MSYLPCKDANKIVIKTEPVDSFDCGNQQLGSGGVSKDFQTGKREKPASSSAAVISEKEKNIKRGLPCQDDSNNGTNFDNDVYNNNVFSGSKERNVRSKDIKKNTLNDDLHFEPKGRTTEKVSYKRSSDESCENYNKLHSLSSKQLKKDENSQNTVDMKPDITDLDNYSRSVSKSNSVQSLSASKIDKSKREKRSKTDNKIDESKKRGKYSEMMKPLLNEDGSVTLYQCEECNKVFNKKLTLRQHLSHTPADLHVLIVMLDARVKETSELIFRLTQKKSHFIATFVIQTTHGKVFSGGI